MQSQGEYYHDKLLETIKKFDDGYMIAEIGTDKGTTAYLALKAMNAAKTKKWFHTIDPYGDKPYKAGDSNFGYAMGYNDPSYRDTVFEIKKMAKEYELNHTHWKITSLDFMKIFPQIQFWSDGGVAQQKFCFAYLDGDHNWDPVREEFKWFYERIPVGGVICIDDYNLLGGENEIRIGLTAPGEWFFNESDSHYRCYFTKA